MSRLRHELAILSFEQDDAGLVCGAALDAMSDLSCEADDDRVIEQVWREQADAVHFAVGGEAHVLPSKGGCLELAAREVIRASVVRVVARYRELEAMNDEALKALYARLKVNERAEYQSMRDRLGLREELFAPFNEPEATANIALWRDASSWSLEEALALSCGKNPEVVTIESVTGWKSGPAGPTPFQREFKRRHDLIARALAVGDLADPTRPSAFLSWARDKNLDCPAAIHVEPMHESDVPGVPDLMNEIALLKQRIKDIEATENDLNPKSLTSLRHILLGMAIKKYGYKPTYSEANRKIAVDCSGLGLPTTPETVKKWLDEAYDAVEAHIDGAHSRP